MARRTGTSNAAPHDPAVGDGPSLYHAGGQVDREALYALYEQLDEDDAPVSVRFTLGRDLNKRLDKYLVDRVPFLSRTSLQRLIREQAVTVNGRPPKAATRLHAGDVVEAVLPPPPSSEIKPEPIPIHVLYEDDDLIVINKQDDIIVHPARGNLSGTLINALAYHFQHKSSGTLSTVGEEHARPGVVHRLDRHTTGVMVAAKSETAHWRLGKQFEHRKTDKRYLAVVHGRIEPHADVVDLPLGPHPTVKHKYAVRWDDTGKSSVTVYRVRELYDDYTLLELELKSGRTHQIRVHLSHLGYPIVGDDIYGGRRLTIADITGPAGTSDRSPRDPVIQRQALHAALLGFTHPITEQRIEFQAPLHDDMADLVRLLRDYRHPRTVNIPGATIDLDRMLSSGTTART